MKRLMAFIIAVAAIAWLAERYVCGKEPLK